MLLQVGSGDTIIFWFDRWCDNGPLHRSFPRLYSLSTQQHSLIGQTGHWQGDTWDWQLSWRQVFFDWELVEVTRLYAILGATQPRRGRDDWVSWRNTDIGSFPIRSIVEKVYESFTPILSKQCIQAIWRNPSPPRAQLTLWLASLGKLKTGDKLVAQGFLDDQQVMCPFCNSVIESNMHILFTCFFSWRVWMDMLEWRGFKGVFHSQCSRFMVEWGGFVNNKRRKKLWAMVLGCVIWSLWYERNRIRFEQFSPDLHRFIYSLKVRIGLWAKELLGFTLVSPVLFANSIDAYIS